MKTIEDFRPAIHRQWIKEGKLTIQESNNLIRHWIRTNQYPEMSADDLQGELERRSNYAERSL